MSTDKLVDGYQDTLTDLSSNHESDRPQPWPGSSLPRALPKNALGTRVGGALSDTVGPSLLNGAWPSLCINLCCFAQTFVEAFAHGFAQTFAHYRLHMSTRHNKKYTKKCTMH